MAAGEGLRVAVIVPAYQAAATIEKVLTGVPAWVEAIYVIDDGSRDDTAERVRAANDPRVRLLAHGTNLGVGRAMVTGYRHALRQGLDICVKMDADDQMDPSYLPDLIRPLVLGRADYAKGNRFHDLEALRGMPTVRRVGNAALSFLLKAASGQWHIFDPTNGYTAIHRDALAALDLMKLHPRYFFESSMLVMLGTLDAAVEDVPIPARYRTERSGLSIGRALIEFPWLLFRYAGLRVLWRYFVLDFNAVSLFLVSGVPLIAFGLIFGVYHWIDSVARNVLTPTGTIMLAVLPLILGFQLLLQALVLDIQNRPQRPLQARPHDLASRADRPANPADPRDRSDGPPSPRPNG